MVPTCPVIGSTQELRGEGQPAVPDQGYLLILLLLLPPAESDRRRQDHAKPEPEFLPGEQIRTEGRRGREKNLVGSRGPGRGVGVGDDTETEGPVRIC